MRAHSVEVEITNSGIEGPSQAMHSQISGIREKLANGALVMSELVQNLLKIIEENEHFQTLKTSILRKGNDVIASIHNLELSFKLIDLSRQIKASLFTEVSKQAVIFGCGGLLAGAMFGLVLGYTVRSKPSSSPLLNGSLTPKDSLMKAVVVTNTAQGLDGVMMVVLKTPEVVKSDDVLIQVKAVGLDFIDVQIASTEFKNAFRQGRYLPKIKPPFTLGRECSGIVVDVGKGVQSLEINDRVWVSTPLWENFGVMSEFIVVPEKYVSLKPSNISFDGAATMPYAFVTIWNELLVKRQLSLRDIKNKRVLIHLGLSTKNDGVGLLVTQVMSSWGARVTLSTEESFAADDPTQDVAQRTFLHSFKTLGAESHLIIPADFSQFSNLAQRLFDVVINTDCPRMSGVLGFFCKNPSDTVVETFPIIPETAKGIIALFGSFISYPVRFLFQQNSSTPDSPKTILDEFRDLVESRTVMPVVSKSFIPSQYDQALRHVAKSPESALANAKVGKSVLIFKSSINY